jgi:pilus assembly protein TadC
MTVPFAVGTAIGLLVAALTLLALPRGRNERDAAAALGDRPVTEAEVSRELGVSTPRARAPTSEEIAASMVLLSVALQSGSGVVEAIEHVAQVAPAVPAAELAVVAAGLRWGLAEDRAWAEVDARWSRTALALRMARESGVPPSSLLVTGADDLRSARLAAIDIAAARLGVRLVIPLGVAFLPAFLLTTVVPVVLALAHQVLAA